jgi:hypothetical protein
MPASAGQSLTVRARISRIGRYFLVPLTQASHEWYPHATASGQLLYDCPCPGG